MHCFRDPVLRTLEEGSDNPGFPGGSVVKKKTRLPMQETQVRAVGQEDPLEKEMATHSRNLAWENPKDRGA